MPLANRPPLLPYFVFYFPKKPEEAVSKGQPLHDYISAENTLVIFRLHKYDVIIGKSQWFINPIVGAQIS